MTRETERPFDYFPATADELEPFIGRSWAICRNTPANRERYEHCITPKQYADAERKAIEARGWARPAEKVIRDLIALIETMREDLDHDPAIVAARATLEKSRTP